MNQSPAIASSAGSFGKASVPATTDKRPSPPTETRFPHGRWLTLAILFPLIAIRLGATPAFHHGLLAAQDPSYLRDVRPILDQNCTSCHQPASKQADLDLTTYAGFLAGGKRGPAFVAGSPDQSLVIQFITAALKPSMPFGQSPLAERDVATIRDWIKSGARDDSLSDMASSESAPGAYHQPPVITALRFSPDGQALAVSGNREVLLHHADGSGLVKRLPGKAERILSIAFSADGNLMIAGGGTPARFGEIQFWEPRDGKLLRVAQATNDTVFGASLSPDASRVAVGCADNTVRAFETATGKELYKINTHENWVLGTTFGTDSKRLVSVGRDRAAKLIDADAGQFLENVNQMRGELAAVARHPKADEIVIGGEDRIPYIYRMDRPRNMKVGEDATLIRQLAAQDGAIFALDWSPDGTRVAVGGAAPSVTIYDADSGSLVASCTGHVAGIYAVAFSPDSLHLATGGFDGQVRLYGAKDCTLEKSFVPVPLDGGTQ
jgi:WD40 repeat protein